MPEFSLSISFSIAAVLLAALVSGLLSFISYRRTIPPIPRRVRIFLFTLRTLGLFTLFLLIGEPLLSLVHRLVQPPQTLVLVDNSRSMTISDNRGVRSESLRALFETEEFRRLSEIGEVRFAAFDSRTHFFSSFTFDSLTLDGDATDISRALRDARGDARRSNVQSVVLVSDGNNTSGGSPLFEAEDLHIPLFTIGIGDTTEQRDILIRNVLTNALAYAGSRVPVNVTVKSSGFEGDRVEVTLRDSATVVDRQTLSLQRGTRDYRVTLYFVPREAGLRKYRVDVSTLPGELTDRNNRSTFMTKVLESKMRVLLLAGAPSPDGAFLFRILQRDENIDVTSSIGLGNGKFSGGEITPLLLSQQDCLVLVNIPIASTNRTTLQMVADAARNGKPVFFLASRQLDLSKMTPLDPVLPLIMTGRATNEVQAFLHIPDQFRSHVLFQLHNAGGDPWSSLPPVFLLPYEIQAKPEAQTLGYARVQNMITNIPFLAIRNVRQMKSIAVTGYGLWRWRMLADQQERTVLDDFVGNSIRWLTTREDDRKIRVSPARDFFSSQDPVEFVAQVYDDSYQPVDDATVTVSVSDGTSTQELLLPSAGNGQYAGRLESRSEGDYTFRAVVERNGSVVGRETGMFSVGDRSLEFLETKANALLLRQLSAKTGGTFMRDDNTTGLAESIRSLPAFAEKEVIFSAEQELWNSQWSLLVLFLLFSTEWFVRKRFAMV